MPGSEPKIDLSGWARLVANRVRQFLNENKRSLFFYLALAVFSFQLLLTTLQCRNIVDDAYISARFARNLSQGSGLVYNRSIGESQAPERVEGYSNFLWVLILALGWKLGLSMRFIAQSLGVLSALGCSAFLFLWVRRETGNKWLALIASSLLASNIYFAAWEAGGLETPLFSLLLTGAIFAISLEKKSLIMVLALFLALTRPDGVLFFAGIAFLQFRDFRKNPALRRQTVLNWLWFVAPFLAYFTWRAVYYHSFLPNTFYAKTGLGLTALREGAIYLGGLLVRNPGITILLGIGLLGWSRRKNLPGSTKPALVFVLIYLLFLFLAGGDWMPGYRLAVPLFPLIIGAGIIIAGALWELKEKEIAEFKPRFTVVLLGLALAANLFGIGNYSLRKSFEKEWLRNQSRFYMPAADWLRKHVWQGQSIALGDIGYIGYFGDHDRIIDTMGLMDRHLGRLKGIASMTTDLDYIFGQKPFCIVSLVHKYPDGNELGHSEFDRAIVKDPRFARNYRLVHELFGWQSEELSRSDWKTRTSQVYFRFYFSRQ